MGFRSLGFASLQGTVCNSGKGTPHDPALEEGCEKRRSDRRAPGNAQVRHLRSKIR